MGNSNSGTGNQKRGFITVATGEWYCYLAKSLLMSYRLFSGCSEPFYVITDKRGERELSKLFDGVIVLDEPNYNFLDKILVYRYSPFDETIFLDADMHIIKDISFIFKEFEKNGSAVSCYGTLKDITDSVRPNHFGQAAIDYFGLKQYVSFGGGIYYYKKSREADCLMKCIFEDLMPNYDRYEMRHIGAYFGEDIRRMADEPLLGLAMLINGMKPISTPPHLMRHYSGGTMMKTIKWDFDNRDCSFFWWGEIVHPYIVHYATYNTWTLKYWNYSIRLVDQYYHVPIMFVPVHIAASDISWMFQKRQRESFIKWLKLHLNLKYFKTKLQSMIK